MPKTMFKQKQNIGCRILGFIHLVRARTGDFEIPLQHQLSNLVAHCGPSGSFRKCSLLPQRSSLVWGAAQVIEFEKLPKED